GDHRGARIQVRCIIVRGREPGEPAMAPAPARGVRAVGAWETESGFAADRAGARRAGKEARMKSRRCSGSLSPVLRGEGWGEGTGVELRNSPECPLTLTLSPEYRGEGTGIPRDPSSNIHTDTARKRPHANSGEVRLGSPDLLTI